MRTLGVAVIAAAIGLGTACIEEGKNPGESGDTPPTGPTTGATGPYTGTTGTTPTTGSTSTGYTTTECGGVFQVATTWYDDGGDPWDVPAMCGDSITVDICDPLGETSWWFGMAETGSPVAWTGEDCLYGYGAFQHCHPIAPGDTLVEVASCSPNDIVDGVSTLMDATKDGFTTYYLEDSTGYCFTWGSDVTYYAGLGCAELVAP